jgi:ribonucleoside-diphosphate reductase alpha chain
MAARLAVFHLRKRSYQQFEPPELYKHVSRLVKLGKYDKQLLQDFSIDEFSQMDERLDHWSDMNFTYVGISQMEGKYLGGCCA